MVSSTLITISMVKIGAKVDSPLIIVADADAIVAQVSQNDNLHDRAIKLAQKLTGLKSRVLYPVTAITEATTHIQRVLNNPAAAYETAMAYMASNLEVVEVNKGLMKMALQFFSPAASKKNTLQDCIVAAIAKDYSADAVFSFDRFYKTKGFKLASEL